MIWSQNHFSPVSTISDDAPERNVLTFSNFGILVRTASVANRSNQNIIVYPYVFGLPVSMNSFGQKIQREAEAAAAEKAAPVVASEEKK